MQVERYLARLAERRSRKRITAKHQLIGLEIASLLRDETHRSLYMKLAKEGQAERLLALAKDVASRRRVANHGGYFMRVAQEQGLLTKKKPAK